MIILGVKQVSFTWFVHQRNNPEQVSGFGFDRLSSESVDRL